MVFILINLLKILESNIFLKLFFLFHLYDIYRHFTSKLQQFRRDHRNNNYFLWLLLIIFLLFLNHYIYKLVFLEAKDFCI